MKRYSVRFKKAVVELYQLGRTVAYLHHEYTIPKSTIYNWLRRNEPEALKITITINTF